MKTLSRRAVVAVIVAAMSVCLRGDARVAAEVGSIKISADALLDVLTAMRKTGSPNHAVKTMSPEGRAEVLEELVQKRLFAEGARSQRLDKRPDVAAEIDWAVSEILARRYREWAAGPQSLPEQAVKAYYDNHPDAFRTVRRVKVRHIVVKTQLEAESVVAELKAGASFGDLAAKRSIEGETASKGGDLGWVPRGRMVKAFEDAAFALQPGQLSGIVKTSFGFHVLRVDDIEESTLPPFESVKDDAREKAAAERLVMLRQTLEKSFPVRIHRDVLDSLGK